MLTDPLLGACQPALPGTGLLHDPDREQVLDALKEAFVLADHARATLLVGLLGHGIARGDDFYYLSVDATGLGRWQTDVHLSQQLKELLRDSDDLDGLLILLDTCHAGVAAQQAARWGEVGLGITRRYELLSASADEPAYGGDFTRTLIRVLRSGVPTAGSTVDARYLRAPLQEGARAQRPQRVTIDGGGWAQPGDEGLWLAHNAALRGADDATPSLAQDQAAELTAYLQPTPTLDALVAATHEHRCVVVTGPRGSGKSTLAAALTLPAAARGRVPEGLVQAITFGSQGGTLATLAAALAGQLTNTVPGFAQAARVYDASLDRTEREGLPALHRRVVGPLSRLQLDLPVRLVIDAVDELPDVNQERLVNAVTAACQPPLRASTSATGNLRFVLTARPGVARPAGAHMVPIDQPGDQIVAAYLRQRGVADTSVPLLVGKAAGSWLHARVFADLAVRPGFDPVQLPAGTAPELTVMYEAELLMAGAGNPVQWQSQLSPVLAVLAVVGAGPVLPLPLAVAASARLDGPRTAKKLRDVMVQLSGLIVRSQPGQPGEQLGLFHISVAEDYLLQPESQFQVDPTEAHNALAEAIADLAPAAQHDPTDSSHRYALAAEAHHRWHGSHDSNAVIEILTARTAGRAIDERERWQPWPAIFTTDLGPEHLDTLRASESLAAWSGEAGDAAAARDQYAKLVPIRERVSGREHPDTLHARASLALWTGEAGDEAAARDHYAKLVPILERVSGREHPKTLHARAALARRIGEAGNPAAARDQFTGLLPLLKQVWGRENIDTLAAMAGLATWTGQAGDELAARDQYAELIPVFERLLGPEHPDTLTARTNRASWTGRARDPAAARDQFAELVPIWEQVFGPEYPGTLLARAEFAQWIGHAGDPVSARDRYAELLPVFERKFGPEHPHTLNTRTGFAYFSRRSNQRLRHAHGPRTARAEIRRLARDAAPRLMAGPLVAEVPWQAKGIVRGPTPDLRTAWCAAYHLDVARRGPVAQPDSRMIPS